VCARLSIYKPNLSGYDSDAVRARGVFGLATDSVRRRLSTHYPQSSFILYPVPPTPLSHLEYTFQNDSPLKKSSPTFIREKLSLFLNQKRVCVFVDRRAAYRTFLSGPRGMTAWYVRGGGLPAVYRSGRQAEEPCHGVSVGRSERGVCRVFCTVDFARVCGAQQGSHCSRSEETWENRGRISTTTTTTTTTETTRKTRCIRYDAKLTMKIILL